MVEVMKIMVTFFKRSHAHCYTQCLQLCKGHHQPMPPPETPGHSWASLVSLLWANCSFLLGPAVHRVLFVPSNSLFESAALNMPENLENSSAATRLEKVNFHSNPKERQCQRILNTNTYHRQSCPTLCDPMECSPLGSSVDGILQARILEWVAISFSRGCSQPRD